VKTTRKIFLLPFAGVALMLAVASVAYACTIVKGQATITAVTHTSSASAAACSDEEAAGRDCAAPADVVTVKATGAAKNRTYNLHFLNYLSMQDGMGICMGPGDQIIGGPVTSDRRGNIPPTDGIIPANATPSSASSTPTGPASVCFITPGYGYGTVDDVLDIVVI
jgi:hypothetical protein